MVQAIKNSSELMKNRLSRRGYKMEEGKNVLQKRNSDLIYLKQESCSQCNIRGLKRFY